MEFRLKNCVYHSVLCLFHLRIVEMLLYFANLCSTNVVRLYVMRFCHLADRPDLQKGSHLFTQLNTAIRLADTR